MFGELRRLCADLDVETPLRALILTGAGRGFCAGLDLADAATLPDMPAAEMLRRQQGWADVAIAVRELPIPVIAAVNGLAAGAGFSLALAADIRIAAPSARFNAAFVRVGLSGGDVGSSWLLPRIVGLGQAYELLLTGRPIDAVEAHRLGIVNRVVSAEQLLPEAVELAEEIAGNSPFGVRLTKQTVQANVDAPSPRAAIDLENRNQVLATRADDMREALSAFTGKRAPEFTGRWIGPMISNEAWTPSSRPRRPSSWSSRASTTRPPTGPTDHRDRSDCLSPRFGDPRPAPRCAVRARTSSRTSC